MTTYEISTAFAKYWRCCAHFKLVTQRICNVTSTNFTNTFGTLLYFRSEGRRNHYTVLVQDDTVKWVKVISKLVICAQVLWECVSWIGKPSSSMLSSWFIESSLAVATRTLSQVTAFRPRDDREDSAAATKVSSNSSDFSKVRITFRPTDDDGMSSGR